MRGDILVRKSRFFTICKNEPLHLLLIFIFFYAIVEKTRALDVHMQIIKNNHKILHEKNSQFNSLQKFHTQKIIHTKYQK
jgi:hypothetical protein